MTIGELVTNGGWAMYPIYLCSLVAAAIFLKKAREFFAGQLTKTDWLEPVLEDIREQDLDSAIARSKATPNPVGNVIASMLGVFTHRPDRVEAEAVRTGSLALQSLEKNVGGLSFIAQVAPLLGLLGTVVGMVELFMGLGSSDMGQVDASMLSSGIWTALLTTAAGLLVAVPALAAYTYLNSRTDAFRLTLSDSIARVLTALPESATGQSAASQPVTSKPVAQKAVAQKVVSEESATESSSVRGVARAV